MGEGFPKDAPQENGGTHIGIYLAWIINNNMVGELHLEESKIEIDKVKKREITGRTFLINECDSKFFEDDLNDEGLAFSLYYYFDYYSDNGKVKQYLMDYAEMFIKEPMTFWDVEDTWENYDRIKPVIDERFRSWKVVRKIYEQNDV